MSVISTGYGNPVEYCYNTNGLGYGNKFLEIEEYTDTVRKMKKFTLYYFDDEVSVANSKPNDKPGCSGGYQFGVYETFDIMIYDWISESGAGKKLAEEYVDEYVILKDNLDIYPDFSFNFKDMLGNEIDELTPDTKKNPPKGINVDVGEFPIRVFRVQGNKVEVREYIFSVRVWE